MANHCCTLFQSHPLRADFSLFSFHSFTPFVHRLLTVALSFIYTLTHFLCTRCSSHLHIFPTGKLPLHSLAHFSPPRCSSHLHIFSCGKITVAPSQCTFSRRQSLGEERFFNEGLFLARSPNTFFVSIYCDSGPLL